MGLKSFSTDSDGTTVENPRYLRRAEKRLKRLHRRVSNKQKGSKNRKKAIKRLAKGYLKVSRQRKDFACKQASALVKSSDFLAVRLVCSKPALRWGMSRQAEVFSLDN